MGPKRRSLAQLSAGFRRGARLALFAWPGALALCAPFAAAAEPPLAIDLTERQEIRRVQVDVSVVSPKGDGLASVPDLTRDMFDVRLDGVRLSPDQLARVEFDEICPARRQTGEGAPLAPSTDDRPTLIALIDLNFLDLGMRHATSRALKDLAELAARQPMRIKVLAFARRLIPLTPDFTSDPRDISRAADALIEIPAAGPPMGRLTSAVQRTDPFAAIDSTPLSEQTDLSSPIDPTPKEPAFLLDVPGLSSLRDDTARLPFQNDQAPDAAFREVDARPSLSALESVLLSHSALRGRKALVLFTSSWFDLPEDRWLTYLVGPRQAAQGGFTIWAADARGLSRGAGAHDSRILSYLSASTGGDILLSAGRLAIAFERALSQLSCYYLFTIPIKRPLDGVGEHDVDIRLDTNKHPEFWSYRVRTVSGVTVLDRRRLRARRRLAALMEADAYRLPEVRLTASYPTGAEKPTTVLEIGTLLSDLIFTAEKDRPGVAARFAIEGLVSDVSGRTVCQLGDGQERKIHAAEQPARFPPSVLVVSTRCALPGPGVYEARVIVEDLSTEDIGAASVRIEFAPVVAGLARVSALRLGRSSGRDFLYTLTGAHNAELKRDREHQSFIPLSDQEGLLPQDRLMLRFVACGVADAPAVILYQQRAEAAPGASPGPAPRALFRALVSRRGEQKSGGAACAEYEAVVPESTLAPGDYGLMLLEPPAPEKEQLPAGGRQTLGSVEFRVLTPAGSPPEPPRRQVFLQPPASRFFYPDRFPAIVPGR